MPDFIRSLPYQTGRERGRSAQLQQARLDQTQEAAAARRRAEMQAQKREGAMGSALSEYYAKPEDARPDLDAHMAEALHRVDPKTAMAHSRQRMGREDKVFGQFLTMAQDNPQMAMAYAQKEGFKVPPKLTQAMSSTWLRREMKQTWDQLASHYGKDKRGLQKAFSQASAQLIGQMEAARAGGGVIPERGVDMASLPTVNPNAGTGGVGTPRYSVVQTTDGLMYVPNRPGAPVTPVTGPTGSPLRKPTDTGDPVGAYGEIQEAAQAEANATPGALEVDTFGNERRTDTWFRAYNGALVRMSRGGAAESMVPRTPYAAVPSPTLPNANRDAHTMMARETPPRAPVGAAPERGVPTTPASRAPEVSVPIPGADARSSLPPAPSTGFGSKPNPYRPRNRDDYDLIPPGHYYVRPGETEATRKRIDG